MSTISRQVVSGFVWSSFSQVVKQGSQIVGIIVLARLLPAADFGVIAMASTVTGLAILFRDFGTTAALIQQENLSAQLLDSVFWFNLVIALSLAMALILLSPIVAIFFSEPRLQEALCMLSLVFPISALGLVHQALMERVSNFKPIALIESLAALLSLCFAWWVANSGWGIYSLVLQTLTSTIITTAGFWLLSAWRPTRNTSFSQIRKLIGFSGNLVGFNVFNYFARNADNLLIGRLLGAADLGFYTMAYRLMLWPLQNISTVVGRTLFPVFSRIQDESGRLASAYLRVTAAIMLISAPLMTGLFVLREPFVSTILGKQWMPVADLLVWLAPVGLLQSLGTTVGALYLATGRTDLMFRWGLFGGIVTVSAFCIGIQWGMMGLVISYAIAMLILFLPSLMIPLRLIGLTASRVLFNVLRSVLVAVGMALIIASADKWWNGLMNFPMLRFLILVVLGIVSYGILSYFFQGMLLKDIYSTLRGRHGRK